MERGGREGWTGEGDGRGGLMDEGLKEEFSHNATLPATGWGGVKSDVGVSHRRQRSKSPPERDTFSDVGAPHGLTLHPQHQVLCGAL